eukprot:388731-Amphidinium_carterae.1
MDKREVHHICGTAGVWSWPSRCRGTLKMHELKQIRMHWQSHSEVWGPPCQLNHLLKSPRQRKKAHSQRLDPLNIAVWELPRLRAGPTHFLFCQREFK